MSWLLPTVTFLPLLAAVVLLAVPREEEDLHRGIGFATALLTFLLSLLALSGFEPAAWNQPQPLDPQPLHPLG